MAQYVKITGAPGFVDGFIATLIPGLHEIPSTSPAEGPVTIISTSAGEVLAVPSVFVSLTEESPLAQAYRSEWSVKADRNPSDVYIPEALR